MKYRRLLAIPYLLLISLFAIISSPGRADPGSRSPVADRLRARLETTSLPLEIEIGDEVINASVVLPRFYESRGYHAAWADDDEPLPIADSLIAVIQEADRHGLRLEDYHFEKIQSILSQLRSAKGPENTGWLVDLDLLLTDAFLIYGAHLMAGRVNPETIDAEWVANRREKDLAAGLADALRQSRIREFLQELAPTQSGYRRLQDELAHYHAIAARGGWPAVPAGPTLEIGERNERVRSLRARLSATDDLDTGAVHHRDDLLFDELLDRAVRRFQARYGLEIDGKAGKHTLAALNQTVEQRIDQITVNLERWRWLPESLGRQHIIINIANFELDVVEDETVVMNMRAIVGRSYRRTPVFSDRLTYLVFSPYWHIPRSLAIQDILPQIRKDSTYLTKQKIRVFRGWGGERREIDPATINWPKVTATSLDVWLRQDPGPLNSLGGVKFMFPNKFNVYLHDTPKRELFGRTERGFSSGCIRIEKPVDLAAYLLHDDTQWSTEKILAAMNQGTEQAVQLRDPLLIHLLYWTCWVEPDGIIHFRRDIYDRDRRLAAALAEPPPRAQH